MKHYRQMLSAFCAAATGLASLNVAVAQEDEEPIEEIVTVGSQIKGAKITGALSISVVNSETIEMMGIDSGDELLDLIPENGQNFFNEAENISGGVNSARGDIGAFNLRSLGTGNTLTLLNGRRVVNAAGFQTEEIGGSFVPVVTANSNSLPVYGIERVEVLRDGASAIYGADAVAGVVNTVLQKDFEGFTIRGRYSDYENIPRSDQTLTLKAGKDFNGGATNVGIFVDYYTRDRVNSNDDPNWSQSDHRYRIPEGSPWEGNTLFRRDSSNSDYGQYDVRTGGNNPYGLEDAGFTDRQGEFQTYPDGDDRCVNPLTAGTCSNPTSSSSLRYRYNLNDNRDLVSDLTRTNMFLYVNHEFANGVESFTEVGYYNSDTNLIRHPSASFSSVRLIVGAENYYNPLGPVGSPNRLPDSVIGTGVPVEGVDLIIDNRRFTEVPRVVDNEGTTWRLQQGFRGEMGSWDFDTALTWSRAERDDVTRNRVSNTLMQEALNDPTEAAYNPFQGGSNSNIERALVDVYRKAESELAMVDFKLSKGDLFSMPAGEVGALFGIEVREESFKDDRDPRLDGTIVFTDYQGDTYPFVSDVVNSSPTPDNSGDRTVTSLFGELQMPVFDSLDVQLALRYEDFSDVGDTTVGKIAAGWQVFEPLLIRGSYSTAFRAPNLVTINESIVARTNTRTDWLCQYADDFGGSPGELDCSNSTQRVAQGSQSLEPETSQNFNLGLVFTPIEDLTFTIDYWSIEKEDTIGLFGEENHALLELALYRQQGIGDCANVVGNPANVRDTIDPDEAPIYTAAGICPAGQLEQVQDEYANLDTRKIEGIDLGIYYTLDTNAGLFDFRYIGSFLQTYDQEAGGAAQVLLEAQNEGLIPAGYPVQGFSDLIGRSGNQEDRQSFAASWRRNNFGAAVTIFRIGSFFDDRVTLTDAEGNETRWNIPAMTTANASFDYTMDFGSSNTARARLGINNVTNERAPLSSQYFGYFADAHRDLGRYYYLDLRLDFN